MAEQDPELLKQLVQARLEAGLTHDQLAERLGVSRATISRIESGKRGTYTALVRRWFHECGYRVESISLGETSRTSELADALGLLSVDDLDLALRVMRLLPGLDARGRRSLVGIVEAYEPQD